MRVFCFLAAFLLFVTQTKNYVEDEYADKLEQSISKSQSLWGITQDRKSSVKYSPELRHFFSVLEIVLRTPAACVIPRSGVRSLPRL